MTIRYIVVFLLLTFCSNIVLAQNNFVVKIYKRDTLFNCVAADSLGNVYVASSQRGVFKYDGSNWKDWTSGNGAVGLRRCFMKHMAGGKEGVWLTHSGFSVSVTGGGSPPTFYANATGGVEYIPAVHPSQRIKYQGRSIIARRLMKGPSTKSGLAIAIDKNGTVWSAANYADSQRYYFYDGFTVFPDRYFYSPGGLTFKKTSSVGFDTVVAGMPWPEGINISIGTDGKTESWSIGKRRIARAVGAINSINEVWVSMDSMQAVGETFSNCILRYDLNGTYLGKIDNSGTPLPMGPGTGYVGATSIYEDAKGRIWLGFGNKGLGVRDNTGNWTYIPNPPFLPAGTQIRANAISGNKKGEVYFGTTNGLLIYRPVNGAYNNDTSYKYYTTAQGLPSNNILGVTVDKNGSVWMATGTGVAQLVRGDLSVFNLKPDAATDVLTRYNLRRELQTFAAGVDNSEDTILIAADGSKATLLKWQGSDPKNMKLRIKEDPNGANAAEFGSFTKLYLNTTLNDSLIVQYTHPAFVAEAYTNTASDGRRIKLQVVDTTVSPEKIVTEINVRIVLPPVLMVHGVWSSIASFTGMDNFLKANPAFSYRPYRLLRVFHQRPDHPEAENSQQTYSGWVPNGINTLLSRCAAQKMSVGKVDILGHSRGGIFARLYLQGNFVTYRNDIHKLITINTPHYGSHAANLVLDNRILSAYIRVRTGILPNYIYIPVTKRLGDMFSTFSICDGVDDINGAIELKVTAPALLNSLNGARLNANKTYSHAVTGRFLFGPSFPTSASLTHSLLSGNSVLYTRLVDGTYRRCNLNLPTTLDGLVDAVFDGEGSDLVVPLSSQRGGLTGNHISEFPGVNVAHSNKSLAAGCTPESWFNDNSRFANSVLEILQVQQRVLQLLRSKSESNLFTKDGFGANPAPPLKYSFLQPNPSCVSGSAETPQSTNSFTGELYVDSTIYGKTYAAGDTVRFKITTSQLNNVVVKFHGESIDVFSDYGVAGTDTSFAFPIPKDAFGRIDVVTHGFSQTDIVIDSTWFNVGVPAGITLQSIKVARPDGDDILKVYQGDSITMEIAGFYSDTMRNISYATGKTFSFEVGGYASAVQPNVLKGLVPGLDRMFVSYGGKVDTVMIEVLERFDPIPSPIPVTFTDINARYNNGRVEVQWATATEINNKEFEVQHSADGQRFETFATVPGRLYSNTTTWYNANDFNYQIGRNYYRIKQVDLDGNFKYTKTVMVLVKDKAAVVLYPNPAQNEVNLVIGSTVKTAHVRIFNPLGQVVYSSAVVNGRQNITIQTNRLLPGMYYAELLDANKNRVWGGSFIKE